MDGMIWVLRPLNSITGSEITRLVISESERPKPRKKSTLGLRVLFTSAPRKRVGTVESLRLEEPKYVD
ncbi:hypothetical protein AAC387_Pa02g4760 [Persea americana]